MPRHIRVTVGSFDAPVPPVTLNGWDLTPSNIGLAGVGLVGANLTAYTGPATIPSGTTITEKKFTSAINVSEGNIVIERCFFQTTNIYNESMCDARFPQGDLTIQDCEFDGSLLSPAVREGVYGFQGGCNLFARNYIHDVGVAGISITSERDTPQWSEFANTPVHTLVENNYVHQIFHLLDGHHEAGTIRSFLKNAADTRTLTWRGNYLDITQTESVSGGMFIQPTDEPIYNVWLENNVFSGEGWNLDAHDSSGIKVIRNLHVVNNRFRAGVREYYGPVSATTPGIAEWVDNHVYDAGQPDHAGTVVPAP